MAKQSGIHQLKGKVRGMSYYRQKGVEDGLARQINQGLSKRVKEDPGYANTRLNNAEFGSAGSFAGACIRMISERKRTMLKDFATGALAKAVRDVILEDTTHPWGERRLSGTDWQEEMLQRISTYSKVDFSSFVGGVWDMAVADADPDATWTPNAELPAGWGGLLAAAGATGATVQIFAYRVDLVGVGAKSLRGKGKVELVAEDDFTIGTASTLTTPATLTSSFTGAQGDNSLQGQLIVVLPYKTINAQKYILQEYCTFSLRAVTSTDFGA